MTILSFTRVRADGNLVSNGMTVKEMLALGWKPSKVVALRWSHGSDQIEFAPPHAVHAELVPGANFVAGVVYEDDAGAASHLSILNPDGSIHGQLENRLEVMGTSHDGQFSWFEPATTAGPDVFGVVFQTLAGDDFRCDVDANACVVLRVARTR